MIKLDDDLLAELGLQNLPPEEKKRLLSHIYETLEMRVGMELAKKMSDDQLKEFEEFINRNDEAGALRWLEANFPNYKDVVAAEFEKLKLEVKQVAPQISASAAAAGQQPPMAPAPPAPQYQVPQQQAQQQPADYQAPQQPMWPGDVAAAAGQAPAQPWQQPMQPQQPAAPQYPQPPMPSQPQPGQRSDYDLAG